MTRHDMTQHRENIGSFKNSVSENRPARRAEFLELHIKCPRIIAQSDYLSWKSFLMAHLVHTKVRLKPKETMIWDAKMQSF